MSPALSTRQRAAADQPCRRHACAYMCWRARRQGCSPKHARDSDKRLELNGAPYSKAVAGEECSKENNEEVPVTVQLSCSEEVPVTVQLSGILLGNDDVEHHKNDVMGRYSSRAPVVLRGGWDAQFGGTTKIWV